MIEISEIEAETGSEKSLPASFISVLLALVFALLMVSQGDFDPTPANLVNPVGGVSNIFGLTGSLFAGFFFDLFGYSIWALVLGWVFLKRKEEKPLANKIVFGLFLFLSLNHSLAIVLSLQSDLVASFTGLWGYTLSGPVAGLITPWPGLAVSVIFLGLTVPLFTFDSTLFILLGVSWGAGAKSLGNLKQKSGPIVSQIAIYLDLARNMVGGNGQGNTPLNSISTGHTNAKESGQGGEKPPRQSQNEGKFTKPERPNDTLKQALDAYKKQSFNKNDGF